MQVAVLARWRGMLLLEAIHEMQVEVLSPEVLDVFRALLN